MRLPRLQATKSEGLRLAGTTQVGEQVAGDASVAMWPACSPGASSGDAGGSGPSLPAATEKRRATWKVRVSTSTTWSSIMHAEYRKWPSASRRAPCGMVQVSIWSTSIMSGVYTTEIVDGTISPWRLKLATKA